MFYDRFNQPTSRHKAEVCNIATNYLLGIAEVLRSQHSLLPRRADTGQCFYENKHITLGFINEGFVI